MSESQTVVLRRGKPTPPSAIRFARDLLLREGAWQERTLICLSEPQDCVEMTYRELRENAEKAAANLQAMGIGCRGQCVCLRVQQSELFDCLLGCRAQRRGGDSH